MRRAEPGGGHDASGPAYMRDLEEYLWLAVFEQTSAARSGAAVLLVRGALACGDRARAARLAQATQALADGGDGMAGNPDLATAAVHARGLVDGDTAALERAAEGYSAPLARAAATEDAALAAAANGDRAAAVARLRRAYELYEQHGRPADMARVRARLRATGVRLHHWRRADRPAFGWDSLTDTEYRIARLVAQGLSNREVAGQIYLSAHTVAFHLRHIFWKLDVSSRVQLARLVAERGQGQGALRGGRAFGWSSAENSRPPIMARFLWNWIRCSLRVASSSSFQYECPAKVVGTSEPARAREARRGATPSASSPPAATCTAAFARTTSSSFSGSGATLRMLASSGPACSTRAPGARRASKPSRT